MGINDLHFTDEDLGQYRTKIVRVLRSQIFRQIVQ